MKIKNITFSLFLVVLLWSCQEKEYDLIIYSATSAAITAAIQAKSDGLSVLILNPNEHVGGLTTGGLGWADKGVEETIGGLSLDFYKEVYRHYQTEEAWPYEKREAYPALDLALREEQGIFWTFEPKVAKAIFDRWMNEHQIEIIHNARLNSVIKDGTAIKVLKTEKGAFRGKYFMDCSYEGDLFVEAGCSNHVGRESRDTYDESLAGVLNPYDSTIRQPKQWFGEVKPYDQNGKLLFGIADEPMAPYGSGDSKLQAYIYRTCLTNVPENRIEITRPPRYDSAKYELLARYIQTKEEWELGQLLKMSPIPNFKTDINDHSPYSMDYIGANYEYPAGDEAARQAIQRCGPSFT